MYFCAPCPAPAKLLPVPTTHPPSQSSHIPAGTSRTASATSAPYTVQLPPHHPHLRHTRFPHQYILQHDLFGSRRSGRAEIGLEGGRRVRGLDQRDGVLHVRRVQRHRGSGKAFFSAARAAPGARARAFSFCLLQEGALNIPKEPRVTGKEDEVLFEYYCKYLYHKVFGLRLQFGDSIVPTSTAEDDSSPFSPPAVICSKKFPASRKLMVSSSLLAPLSLSQRIPAPMEDIVNSGLFNSYWEIALCETSGRCVALRIPITVETLRLLHELVTVNSAATNLNPAPVTALQFGTYYSLYCAADVSYRCFVIWGRQKTLLLLRASFMICAFSAPRTSSPDPSVMPVSAMACIVTSQRDFGVVNMTFMSVSYMMAAECWYHSLVTPRPWDFFRG
ncbi:hypothetical protein K438DRAFT_1942908 [Mycena galopus ATCC 62051]|nr:hypothetical protein K438DRAFT_1942908 [Mycena galopus ATCC 62051]